MLIEMLFSDPNNQAFNEDRLAAAGYAFDPHGPVFIIPTHFGRVPLTQKSTCRSHAEVSSLTARDNRAHTWLLRHNQGTQSTLPHVRYAHDRHAIVNLLLSIAQRKD
jgi:hypothetical protein